MPVKGSTSYVWFTDQLLGQGATGNVYRGRHKKKGDLCAVKIINAAGHSRLSAIQERELEVMKRLDHKNIVKLLGVEEESQSKEKVMIMELCQGGSLYSVIEEPENSYGVSEDEFLTILKDIASGMEYLHMKGVVHRDVKPGNILRCITDDERSVYKVTDFGGAREVSSEDENFMSMFGTEEYLHPDMYERALLNGPKDRQFDATVDLWSVGVTLYHVATGQLPFRPFGGRKNKESMHIITSKKNRGVISGVQHAHNGEIAYSKQLPATCRLSVGLKSKITPIIAGLLENDSRYKYTFEKFFRKVQEIRELRFISVFSIPTFTHLRVYAHVDAKLSHVQEQLAEQIEISAPEQVLIYKGSMLDDIIEPTTPVRDYPGTSKSSPIVIFTAGDNWIITNSYIPDIPDTVDHTPSGDSHMAKKYSGLMHYLHFILEDILLGEKILKEAASYVSNLTHAWFKGTRGLLFECWKTVEQTIKRMSFIDNSTRDRLKDWTPELLGLQNNPEYNDQYRTIEQTLIRKLVELKQFSDKIKQNKDKVDKYNASLYDKFQKMTTSMSQQLNLGDTKDNWLARSQSHVKDMKRIHLQFKEDKKKVLTYNEDQIHKYEKYKIREICTTHRSLFESILTDILFPLHKKARSNISLLWKYRDKISAIEKEGGKIDDDATKLSIALDDLEVYCRNSFSKLREYRYPRGSYRDHFAIQQSSGFGSDPNPSGHHRDSGLQSSGLQLTSDPSLPTYPSANTNPSESLSKRLKTDGPHIKMMELQECLTRLTDQSTVVRTELNRNTDMFAGIQGNFDRYRNPNEPFSLEETQGDIR